MWCYVMMKVNIRHKNGNDIFETLTVRGNGWKMKEFSNNIIHRIVVFRFIWISTTIPDSIFHFYFSCLWNQMEWNGIGYDTCYFHLNIFQYTLEISMVFYIHTFSSIHLSLSFFSLSECYFTGVSVSSENIHRLNCDKDVITDISNFSNKSIP